MGMRALMRNYVCSLPGIKIIQDINLQWTAKKSWLKLLGFICCCCSSEYSHSVCLEKRGQSFSKQTVWPASE